MSPQIILAPNPFYFYVYFIPWIEFQHRSSSAPLVHCGNYINQFSIPGIFLFMSVTPSESPLNLIKLRTVIVYVECDLKRNSLELISITTDLFSCGGLSIRDISLLYGVVSFSKVHCYSEWLVTTHSFVKSCSQIFFLTVHSIGEMILVDIWKWNNKGLLKVLFHKWIIYCPCERKAWVWLLSAACHFWWMWFTF